MAQSMLSAVNFECAQECWGMRSMVLWDSMELKLVNSSELSAHESRMTHDGMHDQLQPCICRVHIMGQAQMLVTIVLAMASPPPVVPTPRWQSAWWCSKEVQIVEPASRLWAWEVASEPHLYQARPQPTRSITFAQSVGLGQTWLWMGMAGSLSGTILSPADVRE